MNSSTSITSIESTIVALLRENDSKAMDLIYEHYSASIYGILCKMLPDEEMAQDVLQRSFIKVWKNATTYDASKGKLFTWLLNIARNTGLDQLKSKEIKHGTQNVTADKIVYIQDSQSHSKQNIDAIGIKTLLHKLSDEHRQLIELMYFQGYTQAEISAYIPLPLGTVKTKLRNAISQLRILFAN